MQHFFSLPNGGSWTDVPAGNEAAKQSLGPPFLEIVCQASPKLFRIDHGIKVSGSGIDLARGMVIMLWNQGSCMVFFSWGEVPGMIIAIS
jgi:hypothetical protein